MSSHDEQESAAYVAGYLLHVLEGRTVGAEPLDGSRAPVRGGGHIGPTFWADAPWRVEPGYDSVPFTFIIRDAEKNNVRMELEEIRLYEAPDDGTPWSDRDWQPVHTFTQGLGPIARRAWTYRPMPAEPMGAPPELPLSSFQTAQRGEHLCLRVVFQGTRQRPIIGRRRFEVTKHLSVYLAEETLPLRNSPQWYYGDTHYHSNYTNDFKEFGNPVPDTRAAAERIGLDWLVITDHTCDLTDENPYWEQPLADTRWADLGLEVAANSDDRFRLLRGEELTVLGMPGKGDDTLHTLVFGETLDRFIPGAWAQEGLLSRVAHFLQGFGADMFEHLFGPIYPLEAVLSGVDQSGAAVQALLGRTVQDQGALAFAAHPATFAQSPGGEWEFYDLAQPIHGVEAWNGRLSRHTSEQDSPFDHWQPAAGWEEGASKKGIDGWDRILRYRIAQPNPRFVLLAGSDAHGSFNYSEGWWVDWDGFRADDNALGKARTLLFLPHRCPDGARQAPTEAEIADAIRHGRCVVTDGPVLNCSVRWVEDGSGGTRAGLGEILPTTGDGILELEIQATSTTEFGPVESVEVFHYFRGMAGTNSVPVPFNIGHSQVIDADLPTGPGYVRLATVTRKDGQEYRCFTNPVWIQTASPGVRQLRATCVAW